MKIIKLSALIISTFALNAQADENSSFDMFISGEAGYNQTSPKIDESSLGEGGAYSLSNSNDTSYKTRASFAYTDPNQYGLQVDGVYARNGMDKSTSSTVDLAGHAFYRTDKYLLGAITQYRKPNLNTKEYGFIGVFSDLFTPEQFFWGAEGQAYFGQFTLYGQIARQEFINQSNYGYDELGSGLGDHGLALSFKARYFINDNWRVDGSYAYNKVYLNNSIRDEIYNEFGSSANQNTFGLATEYRFANKPYSITASYEHTSIDLLRGLFSVDTNRAMVGFRLNFGKDSLKSRDQSGASLDPISQDALFSTAIGSLINAESFFN